MTAVKHDPHARPPELLRQLFKRWQKCIPETLSSNLDVLDTSTLSNDDRVRECEVSVSDTNRYNDACALFTAGETLAGFPPRFHCYEIKSLPGGH